MKVTLVSPPRSAGGRSGSGSREPRPLPEYGCSKAPVGSPSVSDVQRFRSARAHGRSPFDCFGGIEEEHPAAPARLEAACCR